MKLRKKMKAREKFRKWKKGKRQLQVSCPFFFYFLSNRWESVNIPIFFGRKHPRLLIFSHEYSCIHIFWLNVWKKEKKKVLLGGGFSSSSSSSFTSSSGRHNPGSWKASAASLKETHTHRRNAFSFSFQSPTRAPQMRRRMNNSEDEDGPWRKYWL